MEEKTLLALPSGSSPAPKLELGFDVGHSSIGWSVFQSKPFQPLGTGSVIFPSDDCLTSKRRDYRRQRRHIRSTRQRIERIKQILESTGFLSRPELDSPGSAWPWKLAAQVLSSGQKLSPSQLWDVIRWYAHNRGYDGNISWARMDDPKDAEDTKKVEAARTLMEEHKAFTMAETFCSVLGINPLEVKSSSIVYFKGLGVAFPRDAIQNEVRLILEKHFDPVLIRLLLEQVQVEDLPLLQKANIMLPKRYSGGLLFGQLVPRFDNRIITSCPITYERVYSDEIAKHGNAETACYTAERAAKVPAKKSREFLLYRWAMLLANIRVEDKGVSRPLHKEERQSLHTSMIRSESGKMTKRELIAATLQCTSCEINNIAACLVAPDAEKALILRPEKGRAPSGRAPYARPVLKLAALEVLQGLDPREKDGILYQSDALRSSQLKRKLSDKTNNHLVRHRLLILHRLLNDIIKDFAAGQKDRIGRITIEVNRDLQTFSGLTAKEKEQDMGKKLSDFNAVIKRLRNNLGEKTKITPSLIRKGRIAQDLNWTCPYTGEKFDDKDLTNSSRVDKDHIIPRSLRPSDSLDSLVITSPEVNRMKDKRTAAAFIKEFGGHPVVGRPNIYILTWKKYEESINKLESFKGHDQDKKRKKRRKHLLLMEHYVEKEFLPKDLTQTSHLVRLAAEELKKEFLGQSKPPIITSMPGSVTGEVRKAWHLEGCLAQANPQIADLIKKRETTPADVSLKQEIRGLTHLHHALDACVLACASHYLGRDGGLWKALVQRRKNDIDNRLLMDTGIYKLDTQRQARLQALPEPLKNAISKRLAECRVVQHLPSSMRGMRSEETVWRVLDPKDSHPSALRLLRWAENSGVTIPSEGDPQMLLVRRIRRDSAEATKPNNLLHEGETYWWAWDLVSRNKLVGPSQAGKLNRIKGAKQIGENYGIHLNSEPQIIPFHQVHARLAKLGKSPVLRKGQIIQVPQGRYQGTWKVFSVKDTANMGLVVDLGYPDRVRLSSKGERQKINVSLKTLRKEGLKLLKVPLTGISNAI